MKTFIIPILIAALVLIAAAENACYAQTSPIPTTSTDKAASTPDFYQEDPRGGFAKNGDMYCAPVAASDCLMYLGSHGFGGLVPTDTQNPVQAQAEMINTLATDRYMRTVSLGTTGTAGFVWGLRAYVQDHGYVCKRLEFAGPAALGPDLKSYKVANQPNPDWIRTAVADPNGFAWLFIGRFIRGNAGQWVQNGGHVVAVVGYGPNGTLIVHNPNRESFLPPASSIADDEVTLTPLREGVLTGPQGRETLNATGFNIASGPGLPLPPHVDAYIITGAVILVVGKPAH